MEPEAAVDVCCTRCWRWLHVPPNVSTWTCVCEAELSFVRCKYCRITQTTAVPVKQWLTCDVCGDRTGAQYKGENRSSTAGECAASLEWLGLQANYPEGRLLPRNKVVSSHGLDIPEGKIVTVAIGRDSVVIAGNLRPNQDRIRRSLPRGPGLLRVEIGQTEHRPQVHVSEFLYKGVLWAGVNLALEHTQYGSTIWLSSEDGGVSLENSFVGAAGAATILEPLIHDWNPQTSAAPSAPEDPTETLAKLAKLHDAGVLTDEEFTTKKTEILNRI